VSEFYVETLERLVGEGILTREMSVLVVCGGTSDRDALVSAGFRNATISNVDERTPPDAFAPLGWSYQDAEDLKYPDGAFDVVIAHSGLHHCRSPHRGLLEMYRVCRVALLVFEPADNVVTRLGVRLGVGQDYEIDAVADNDGKFGGQRNTEIPNYVYRWTEREVEKTVASYAPIGRHRFRYFYKLRVPWVRVGIQRSWWLMIALAIATPVAKLVSLVFPTLSNNFAFAVVKPRVPEDLHAWLKAGERGPEIDREYLARRYRRRAPA
jgi:ubiquinone/menaquinone biosynthesis C-methylase UbiE